MLEAKFWCKLCGGKGGMYYTENGIIFHLGSKHKVNFDLVDETFFKSLYEEANY